MVSRQPQRTVNDAQQRILQDQDAPRHLESGGRCTHVGTTTLCDWDHYVSSRHLEPEQGDGDERHRDGIVGR